MNVGVLALQGDFRKHQERLLELGSKPLLVRKPTELASISALVIPGGESTAFLRLADEEMRTALRRAIVDGLPTLATCAGVILLAKHVENPTQESLDILDIRVERNSYGRQVNSFITPQLTWTNEGEDFVHSRHVCESELPKVEGVFIRAPRIVQVHNGAQVLLRHDTDAVLVRQNNILAATFHPELSDSAGSKLIHEMLLTQQH